METLAQATHGDSQFLVNLVVTVVVEAITDLGDRPGERITRGNFTILTVGLSMQALPRSAGYFPQALVSRAIAVLIDSIANLTCSGVDIRIKGSAVRDVGISVAIIIRVHAVLETVQIGVRKPFVRAQRAVVVDAVAFFNLARVDVGVIWRTVGEIRVPVTVIIFVARVSIPIVVKVLLPRIFYANTVVRTVVNAVSIRVVVAQIPVPIYVLIPLPRIEQLRAVVQAVGDPIAVDIGVASIPQSILVQILLPGVVHINTIIRAVVHAVIVVIRVAHIPVAVPVSVQLLRIVVHRAVVLNVGHFVTVHVVLARVPGAVVVAVHLHRIRSHGAIVHRIIDAVGVIVRVARISHSIILIVFLTRIGVVRAIVVLVVDTVAVQIIIAGIPLAVAIGICLGGVEDPGTIVQIVGHAVSVEVRVTRIPLAVAVQVVLAGVRHTRAVVILVGDAVTICIHVQTVRHTIPVFVGKFLIDKVVAIVVLPVARLHGPRIDHGIQRGAVDIVDELVVVVVFVDAILVAVRIGVKVPLIHHVVAVVVLAVAAFGRARMDVRVERCAVLFVPYQIVVVVQVTYIPRPVQVEVLLGRVGHVLAIVLPVHHAVAILVALHAVCNTIPVGVVKAFVDFAIAVVIIAVALLLLRFCRVAHGHAAQAKSLTFAGPEIVFVHAQFTGSAFILIAVAVVVFPVTHLFRGFGRITVGEPFRSTMALSEALAPIVLLITFSPRTLVRE